RIAKVTSRHVSIVEHDVEIIFSQRFGVVFNQGLRLGPRPLRRIICRHARFPSLQVVAEGWLAGQRQRDRTKLQTTKYAQFETEPAKISSTEGRLSLHQNQEPSYSTRSMISSAITFRSGVGSGSCAYPFNSLNGSNASSDFTTRGSNSNPAHSSRCSRACRSEEAWRKGRASVSEAYASATRRIRAPSGICSKRKPSG